MNQTMPMTSSLTHRSRFVLFSLFALLLLIVTQPSHAKDRIRYHINGPDGSTLRVVDTKGIAVESYRYAPFGEQLASKRPHNLHGQQGFVGGIHESNDLVYLKHRYYNPRIGRFYQPDPVTFLSGGMGQINRYQYGWNDPLTFKDPSGTEPTRNDATTLNGFIHGLNNSPSKVGMLTGDSAASKLINWGNNSIEYKTALNLPTGIIPSEAWLNTQPIRYMYSETVGWLDMQHFMYYAGVAYQFKSIGYSSEYALSASYNKGYSQEMFLDLVAAPHSRFSYEDLVSNYMGAYFGANAFDPNSRLSLGQQINSYLGALSIVNPSQAPNYTSMPLSDSAILQRGHPTQTNRTLTPMYTR